MINTLLSKQWPTKLTKAELERAAGITYNGGQRESNGLRTSCSYTVKL